VVALLTGAFVVACAVRRRPSPALAALVGLLVAAAVSVKATALLPGLVLLGGPLVAAVAGRDRARVAAGLAALGAAVAAALVWFAAVALPNLDRLGTALRIWPSVGYPDSPAALAARIGDYLAHSDQAIGRSTPLLAAAGIGVAAALAGTRTLDAGRREALLLAAGWGLGLWAAIAVGDYAPNRYVVPALPGLAVLAGFGLDAVATLAGRAMPLRAGVVAALLGLAVAAPGVGRFLAGADPGPGQRVAAERTLAARVDDRDVVYGAYAPTLLFDTRVRTVTPWLPARANTDDPVGRFGVTHVLVAERGDPTGEVLAVRDRGALVAAVTWAGQVLELYRIRAAG
jgi:hypothetical protein